MLILLSAIDGVRLDRATGPAKDLVDEFAYTYMATCPSPHDHSRIIVGIGTGKLRALQALQTCLDNQVAGYPGISQGRFCLQLQADLKAQIDLQASLVNLALPPSGVCCRHCGNMALGLDGPCSRCKKNPFRE